MIRPSVEELTQNGKYNRYVLCIAISKCARMVIDEYVEQRDMAEKLIANKETDKSIASMLRRDVRDDKPVKTAINRLYNGEFRIVDSSLPSD
ncbi:MAG: hypothetical protein ACOYID_05330 [Eubacteriales bacterium]|jgi:DNA-directed RNA polymerase subunit K/omega|nr:hypothetical protein [Clostridiales bacterium]